MNYLFRWKIRRTKFYNPNRKCRKCHGQISPQTHYCNRCLDRIRYEGEDQADYQETIQSVLASSYPW